MTAPGARRRAVFVDIDGTYAHHGQVPEAHAEAVRRLRDAGHAVMLCTGRPMSLIGPHLREAGFDGIVACAGAYVELAGEVLVDTRFPAALAERAVAALERHGALYFLEAPDATHARAEAIAAMERYRARRGGAAAERGRRDIVNALRETSDPTGVSFGKITTLHAESPLGVIAEEIGAEVSVIPSSIPDMGPGAGEMFIAGVHKATGMAAALARLGVSRDDVVACGDGPNDREMLAFAGTAVVIEGSDPELIAAADLVAAPPDREGLVAAFVELGRLEG